MQLFNVEQFDSQEEVYFSYYLQELKDAGFINDFMYQPDSFVLTDDLTVFAWEKSKGDNVHKDVKLLQKAHYTADYKIEWNKKAKGLFYWSEGGVYNNGFHPYRKQKADAFIPFFARVHGTKVTSWVDVKGDNPNASGLSKFSIIQKWLESRDEIYIQKVVISLKKKGLFSETFVPRFVASSAVYVKDCKYGKKGDSKIKFDVKLLEHYLKWRK